MRGKVFCLPRSTCWQQRERGVRVVAHPDSDIWLCCVTDEPCARGLRSSDRARLWKVQYPESWADTCRQGSTRPARLGGSPFRNLKLRGPLLVAMLYTIY